MNNKKNLRFIFIKYFNKLELIIKILYKRVFRFLIIKRLIRYY
jgi:hypothetical protein